MEKIDFGDIRNLTESKSPQIQEIAGDFFGFIDRIKRCLGEESSPKYFKTSEFGGLLKSIRQGPVGIMTKLKPFLDSERVSWDEVLDFAAENGDNYSVTVETPSEKQSEPISLDITTEEGLTQAVAMAPNSIDLVVGDMAREFGCNTTDIIQVLNSQVRYS